MKDTSGTRAAALVCTALLVAGCTDGGSDDAAQASAPTSSSQEPSQSSQTPAVTPVDGRWALEQTRADVVEHLEEHGFDKLTDRFLRVEQVWAVDHWEWEFVDGYFTAQWMQPDRTWKVADHGTYEVKDDRLDLTFAEAGNTTTFTWTMQGDELTLDWVDVDIEPNYKSIPDEAFWRAYLTKPLVRVG